MSGGIFQLIAFGAFDVREHQHSVPKSWRRRIRHHNYYGRPYDFRLSYQEKCEPNRLRAALKKEAYQLEKIDNNYRDCFYEYYKCVNRLILNKNHEYWLPAEIWQIISSDVIKELKINMLLVKMHIKHGFFKYVNRSKSS
jgi:hypothetical protein